VQQSLHESPNHFDGVQIWAVRGPARQNQQLVAKRLNRFRGGVARRAILHEYPSPHAKLLVALLDETVLVEHLEVLF
jgi:hypothetical protein